MINGCGSLFCAIAAVLCDPEGKSPYVQNLYSVTSLCVQHIHTLMFLFDSVLE